jgi:hypothetical protein
MLVARPESTNSICYSPKLESIEVEKPHVGKTRVTRAPYSISLVPVVRVKPVKERRRTIRASSPGKIPSHHQQPELGPRALHDQGVILDSCVAPRVVRVETRSGSSVDCLVLHAASRTAPKESSGSWNVCHTSQRRATKSPAQH